jgi:hypothetical protein
LAGDQQQSRKAQVSGSGPWTPQEVVDDIPLDADVIQIAFVLEGAGTAWASNFDFQEVPASVPLTETLPRNLDFTIRP